MIIIGKVVNTHGLKGHIRILSNSDFKELRFEIGNELYINENKYVIEEYFIHKTFDVIKFKNYDNINDILKLKNKMVYAKRDDNELSENEFYNEDLLNLEMINEKSNYGTVIQVIENPAHNILKVKYKDTHYLVPFNDYFIKDVDIKDKKIYFNKLEGLIDED